MMSPTAIETLHGNAFDFAGVLAGESQHYDLNEIAWCLSRLPRFVCHTYKIVSVGEHSVAVSRRAEQIWHEAGAAGMVHDWPETYTGDLNSPLKKMLRVNEETMFDRISDEIERQVWERFGIQINDKILAAVKQADLEACAWERENIRNSRHEWDGLPEVPQSAHARSALAVYGLGPAETERLFWKRCEELRIR